MLTVDITETVIATDCCECGFTIWMPVGFMRQRKRDHRLFHCTSCGQDQYWAQESDIERERRLRSAAVDQLNTVRQQRDHIERRRRGEKAAKTRIKNRIARGVCPCCNRTFANLAKHMAGQHPDYLQQESEG